MRQGAGFETGFFVIERLGGATSFILSMFFALLPRLLPAVSQIRGHIEGPPPSPTDIFYSSLPIEGCNRIWALRTLSSIHDQGFRSAIDVCVPVRIEREQPEQRTNCSLHAQGMGLFSRLRF